VNWKGVKDISGVKESQVDQNLYDPFEIKISQSRF
jgi:hypothetical protein